MKFLDRLGLGIFSTIILILSIILCLMGLNIVQPTIFGILITKALQYQTATYILIGASIFLILLSIKCLFFYSDKKFICLLHSHHLIFYSFIQIKNQMVRVKKAY